MYFRLIYKVLLVILLAAIIGGCTAFQRGTLTPIATITSTAVASSPKPTLPSTDAPLLTPASFLADYAFPEEIDATKHYLFYLHGKIIEDQGIPAISPEFGEYEYRAILEKLSSYGFTVISEPRPKDTVSTAYAKKVAEQVRVLLDSGVPASNITLVGASKGGGIAILASNLLENKELNFVMMAICEPATVDVLVKNGIFLFGNVLSIYESSDELAGSCQGYLSTSVGKGLSRYDEIILNTGLAHGFLFQPLEEWVEPAVKWAMQP